MMATSPTTTHQLTFERREMKYLLTDAQRADLLAAAGPHLVPDEHGPATVRSVYYDTPTLLLARRSAEHPRYKEKLRLRCYGEPRPGAPVFVELKKKCAGVVYKRRVALSPAEARALLAGRARPRSQIGRELAFAAARYESLGPAVYLAYDREAFYAAGDRDLRMTFDVRVRMRWDDPRLDGPDVARQILPDGFSILEVKTTRAMPLWLTRALDELGLRKAHWSKYATACTLHLQGRPARDVQATSPVAWGAPSHPARDARLTAVPVP